MTSKKQIETKLKKLGYYTDINIDEHKSESSVLYKLAKKKRDLHNDNIILELSFDATRLEHCCGIVEIGNLNFECETYDKKTHAYAIELFIQLVFLAARDENRLNVSSKIKTITAIIFVSNGVSGWEIIEEAILKIPEHFLLASVTKNPGSGRILKLFVGKP